MEGGGREGGKGGDAGRGETGRGGNSTTGVQGAAGVLFSAVFRCRSHRICPGLNPQRGRQLLRRHQEPKTQASSAASSGPQFDLPL
jgi:hypothetical protein